MIWPMHGNLITFVTNFLISNKLKSNLKINVFFFRRMVVLQWLGYTSNLRENGYLHTRLCFIRRAILETEKFKCQLPVVVYVIIATFCANATRICLHGIKTINLTVIYHLPHFKKSLNENRVMRIDMIEGKTNEVAESQAMSEGIFPLGLL